MKNKSNHRVRNLSYLRMADILFFFLFFSAVQKVEAQLSQAQETKMDSIFAPWNSTTTPGMELVILQHGKKIWNRSYGRANMVSGTPNSNDRPIWVASMSKQFTGLAIALLVDQKRISLNDDIRKYLPEMPFTGDTIRISHLIYHTSGLREGFTLTAMSFKTEEEYTNANVLKYLSMQQGRNFKPGDRFEYNNGGYVLLALIVERVTKMTFPDFTSQYIFKPLNMNHSRFVPFFPQNDSTMAVGYTAVQENGKTLYQPAFFKGQTYGSSALITTANDLVKWDRIFYEPVFGRWVQRLQLQTGRLNNGQSVPYAFGLEIDMYKNKRSITHSGADAGYKSEMVRFPEEEITVICLANTDDAWGLTNKLFSVSELIIPFKQGVAVGRKTDAPVNDSNYLTSESLPSMRLLKIADSLSVRNAAGTWYSQELEVNYHFFEKDGILYIKFFDAYDVPLTAYANDYYSADFLGMNIIRFIKNADGKFVTMEFTREGIQRLQFKRG